MAYSAGAVLGLVSLLAACTQGCKSNEQAARETFSKDSSCPSERVTAVARPELSAYDLTFGKSAPPANIASDPARVAMWQADQDKTRKGWDDRMRVVEVGGCDEKKYYQCASGKHGTSCSGMTAPVK